MAPRLRDQLIDTAPERADDGLCLPFINLHYERKVDGDAARGHGAQIIIDGCYNSITMA